MSLSCLMCHTKDQSDSELDDSRWLWRCCTGLDRSWSGNLTPPPYAHLHNKMVEREGKVGNKSHHKFANSGRGKAAMALDPAMPRLVRSGGMRRDWSFEDLRSHAAISTNIESLRNCRK